MPNVPLHGERGGAGFVYRLDTLLAVGPLVRPSECRGSSRLVMSNKAAAVQDPVLFPRRRRQRKMWEVALGARRSHRVRRRKIVFERISSKPVKPDTDTRRQRNLPSHHHIPTPGTRHRGTHRLNTLRLFSTVPKGKH